jgi:hypothetical protein
MNPIERLLAERECEKLQVAYALAADRGDADGFTALFAPDASILIPEYAPFVGHAAIHASLVALASSGVTMRHVITNQHVTATGPDRAEGGCYLLVFNNPDPPDASGVCDVRPPGTVGEYADQFVRTDAGWRFRERRLTRVFRPRP